MGFSAMAVETTDRIELSPLTLDPGGEKGYFDVKLVGSDNYYTGYNMDIHLPEGMFVCLNAKGNPDVSRRGIYPYTIEYNDALDMDIPVYTHSLACSYGVVGEGILRVACFSSLNENLTATSGVLFRVNVQVTGFAKPGVADILIDGVALKVAGGSQYDPVPCVDNNVTVSSSASVPVSVSSSAKWSTCVLPFSAEIPSGVTAYSASHADADYLYLTEAIAIDAYSPYILFAEGGFSGNLSGTVDVADYPESGVVTVNGLNGAITLQDVTEGYVLQNGSEGVLFYPIENGDHFSLNPGKCWLSPNVNYAKALAFSMVVPSDIESVAKNATDGALYSLDGKKVIEPVAGQIYIMNGKKVLKK